MAGKWDQVARSEKFQALGASQRQAVRGAFFDREIRPNAPADKLEEVRGAFFTRTEPDVFGPRETDDDGVQALDYAKELGAGLNEGTGSVLQGGGSLLEQGGQWVERGLQAIGLGDAVAAADEAIGGLSPSKGLDAVGDWFSEGGEQLHQQQSDAAKKARADSTPQGDVTKPSTWSMGDDPSIAGYGLQVSNLIGQFAPQAAALLAPGGQARAVGMAGVGGLQAGGAAGEEAEQYVMQQSDENLAKNSGMYRDLVDQGVEPAEAKRQTAIAARGAAFSGAAPVGAGGGALTHYILGPFQKSIGGGVGRRLGYGLAIDAPAEGAQEVAETVAGRTAQNHATQGSRDTTEGTFGDAALGAIAGGGHASLGAAMGERLPRRRMPTPEDIVRDRTPEDKAAAEQQYQADRDEEARQWFERRRADARSQDEAREQFGEEGAAVWQNADNDMPVRVLGIEAEPGEDGRRYARVERDGQESFVPLDELRATESDPEESEATGPNPDNPRERRLGIDNDIRVAEKVGADEDAARLRNAKSLFIRAMEQDQAGNRDMGSRLRQRGLDIHREIYGDPDSPMPERPASFPVPYEFDGDFEVGARPPATAEAPRRSATYDGTPDAQLTRPAERLRQGDQQTGDSLIYGDGPVQRRGNANTGLDQPFGRAKSTDTRKDTQQSQYDPTQPADTPIHRRRVETSGKRATAYLADNTPVPVRYRVMDLDELVPSNDPDGAVNPRFPAELQPRDRTGKNSQVQVRNIAARLNPERLGESSDAGSGSPIVGPDGVVESGNGRTMAIAQAYRGDTAPSKRYRNFVHERAQDFGIDPSVVAGMRNPVLVRERTGSIDRAEFARRANEADVASMTPYEMAVADADRLSVEDMAEWSTDESGDPLAASNRAFTRRFAQRLGNNEASRYRGRDGQPSPELGERMMRAVFAKGYSDEQGSPSPDMLEMVTERQGNLRNLTLALQSAASDFAVAREYGGDEANSMIATVVDAVRIVRQARASGLPVRELVGQADAFSQPVPRDTASLAMFIANNARSRKGLADALSLVAAATRGRAESRRNGSLFGDQVSNEDITNAATRQDSTASDGGEPGSELDSARGDRTGSGTSAEGQETDRPAASGEATPVDEDPLLTTYDEDELRDREQRRTAAQQEEEAQRQQEEERAQADRETDDFTLTGSNRSADVAAAQGQENLIGANGGDRQPEPTTSGEDVAAGQSASSRPEKIDDFGEKLEGARKDYARRIRESLATEVNADTKVSDVFPKLDYQKLIDAGMSKESAAFMAVLRTSIPAKPRRGFKLKRWVQTLDGAREIGQSVMDGNVSGEQLFNQVSDGQQSPAWESLALTARLISGLEPAQFDQAAKWRVDARAGYSLFMGEEVSPNQKFYSLRDDKGRTTGIWSDSFAGIENSARDAVAEHLRKSADAKPRSRQTQINVYRDTRDGDRFIAFKNGSRVVRLRGGFSSVAEASNYIHDNRDALQSEIDEMRRGPEMRNKTNAERMGESVRDGDVSPEQFSDTFGFRGVQFGNYVEGGRRQRDLNDAHDALMDLADTLGIPPKGLSLNGTLGLAFGARGKGGKRPAMAHYEPGQVVINLTKGKGAGSLAHEWFHALDNYIPDGQGRDVFQSDNSADTAARVDLAMRWSEMRNVLRDSGFQQRSRKLDEARSKPYFGTPVEMAARAFEAYTKQRLGERGVRNDYLVNTIETSPAYPTESEMASIAPAFDRLIGTLEHQDTDTGVRLYSMRGAPTGGASPTAESVRDALEPMRSELGDFTVVETAAELPLASQLRLLRDGVDGGDVRGIYSGDRLYIVAGNNESLQRAVTTAVHEAVGHKGIRGVLGNEIEPVMRQLFKSLPLDRRGREALQEVLNTYTFLDRDNPDHQVMIAEEMVAHLLEKGYRPKVWQRAVAAIRNLLRKRFPSLAWTYTDVLSLGERSRDFLRRQQSAKADDSDAYSLRPQRQEAVDQSDELSPEAEAFMAKFGPRTPPRRVMDWYRDLTNRAMLRIRQGLVDQYAALKELDEKRFGKDGALEESITSSSWVLARMSNAANGALHSMLHNGRIYLDPDQKVIDIRDDDSKGLGAVLGQLGSPTEIKRFMMWIAANRSNKLSDEGREFLFTDAEIRAGMQLNEGRLADGSSRRDRYQKALDEFQQYRDDVLAIAEQSGIIRPDQRAMWRDEFYVPFYRLKDDKDVNVQLGTSGLSRQQAFKRLKGGTDNINDLLQNTMMNFHHLLDASLKNQAAQQAIDNAEAMGMAHRVPESNRDTAKSTFVMKDGTKAFYEIDDPMVFSAVSALAHAGMNNVIMKVMRGFKRVFTNMTTTTPQFIVANLMRDTMQAVATNDVSKNVFKNIYDGAGTLRDQRKRARMLAAGGSFNFGHLYSNNPDELRAQLTRNLRDAKVVGVPGATMKGFSAPAQLIRAGWAKWGDMNDFAENLNRAAIYEQSQDRGKLKAAFEARDLVDFSARGAWPAVRILTDIVPFLNARIQGLDKIYRSGVKPGANVLGAAFGKGQAGVSDKQAAARFWSVAGVTTLATIALYLNNHDDEDYQKLEEWQKDTYWFFKIGGQAFFIPKPFEVGAIATLAERVTQQFVDDEATGSLFAQRLGHMLTGTFAFSPVPQMMQPSLDVYANRDSFTDRPIEGMGDQRLSLELRKRSSTSRVAQGASWLLNHSIGAIGNPETNPAALSPIQIDYLIQGYLGQVGAWAAGSVDVAWNTFDGKDEPAKRWYEYQPIRRFYSNLGDEPRYTRYGTVFYEGLREAERAYSDVKELGEMGQIEKARALARNKGDILKLRKPLMRAQRKLNGLRKQIDAIRRSDIDGELKRQRIDRLNAVRNRVQQVLGEKVLEQRAAD